MSDLQRQINDLKRVVVAQAVEINHLKGSLQMFLQAVNIPPELPYCDVCNTVLYDGYSCGVNAQDCPCGVGKLEGEA